MKLTANPSATEVVSILRNGSPGQHQTAGCTAKAQRLQLLNGCRAFRYEFTVAQVSPVQHLTALYYNITSMSV